MPAPVAGGPRAESGVAELLLLLPGQESAHEFDVAQRDEGVIARPRMKVSTAATTVSPALLIGIGAQKSGTTSLFDLIAASAGAVRSRSRPAGRVNLSLPAAGRALWDYGAAN